MTSNSADILFADCQSTDQMLINVRNSCFRDLNRQQPPKYVSANAVVTGEAYESAVLSADH